MLMRSISKASAVATAQQMARSRMRSASVSRRSAGSSLLSRRPRIGFSGDSATAAANTGPNNEPRPTSSTPAITLWPSARASRSCRPPHLNALRGMGRSRLLLFAFAQACGLALEPAQIIQLGAAHAAGAHHIDVIDHRRMNRKNALHALPEADLAHC